MMSPLLLSPLSSGSSSSRFVHLCLLLLISSAASGSHACRDTPLVNAHNALLSRGGGGGGSNNYNITDKHYWVSRTRTGIHGYVIAGIWLLCGVGFGSYIMIKNSRSLGVAANQRSVHKSKKLIDTILDVGSEAQEIMQRTKNILLTIQTVLNPYNSEALRVLNVTTHSLRRESVSVKQFIDSSRHSSKEAIVALYVTNLVVVIANLAFLVAALGEMHGHNT
ncbi:unnamed protein product [Cuscuta campestris]|uniref:Transmembrane protein n=1 Tax=Cuscuta campestris TaxID=132261 RepID=A0A484LFZ0_9ASTE|nr:unnamed protein product [Cuscuta campestris]